MEDWERAAREEIQELAARYNQAGDSGRFEEMLALFAEDGRLDIEAAPAPGPQARPGESYRGRREIRALLEKSARAEGAPQRLRHFTASHQIDFESPLCARGRAYFLVLTARGLDHWGLYRDEYRRAAPNAPWRFTRRQVRVEGRTPGGWAARRG
ncbi:MAG: nuclear transport factor 2 family protein [Deltaproteobacteria bacterium]|nr:nuclear transport factor 2 family protein [Deltaproteobacteria bacterium]